MNDLTQAVMAETVILLGSGPHPLQLKRGEVVNVEVATNQPDHRDSTGKAVKYFASHPDWCDGNSILIGIDDLRIDEDEDYR
jgi:hypothetical protein